MTGRLFTMSDPPPPSNPPPGWYPDPNDQSGYRWWDGLSWTDSVTTTVTPDGGAVPVANEAASPIGQFGTWFSESFRVMIDRAGHFLPMILLFVISISVPTSYAIWYALRNTVLTFDPTTAAPEVSYGGSRPWLIAVIASVPVSTLLSYFCKAAVARQTWAHQAELPEPWSVSVLAAVTRWRRVVTASLTRTLAYWLIGGLYLVAASVTPAFILLFPFAAAALLFVWVRLCFIGTMAVLGGSDTRPLAEGWRLSGRQLGPLTGRLLALAFIAFNMVLAFGILGAPFTAIAGAGEATVEPSTETLRFNDLLGANPSVFALGSLFNAIGLGAGYVLSAAGTTLLYRNLGGPVDADAFDQASCHSPGSAEAMS